MDNIQSNLRHADLDRKLSSLLWLGYGFEPDAQRSWDAILHPTKPQWRHNNRFAKVNPGGEDPLGSKERAQIASD